MSDTDRRRAEWAAAAKRDLRLVTTLHRQLDTLLRSARETRDELDDHLARPRVTLIVRDEIQRIPAGVLERFLDEHDLMGGP